MKDISVEKLDELIDKCAVGNCPPGWEDCFDCAECTFKETLKFLKDLIEKEIK